MTLFLKSIFYNIYKINVFEKNMLKNKNYMVFAVAILPFAFTI